MIEGGERARLPLETRAPYRISGVLVGEDFERDISPETRVARAIHLTHAAATDDGENFVGAEPRVWRERHGAVEIAGIVACMQTARGSTDPRQGAAI